MSFYMMGPFVFSPFGGRSVPERRKEEQFSEKDPFTETDAQDMSRMTGESDGIYDAVVIGGGPVGCRAAESACRNGLSRVLVLEEHPETGSPVQCAGLLSVSAFREAGLRDDDACILNRISGARVFAPSGECLCLKGKGVMAYAVSRKLFDRKLAENAAAAGVQFRMKTTVLKTEIVRMKDGTPLRKVTAVSAGKETVFYARFVIAADGVRSTVSRREGFAVPDRIVLAGFQNECQFRPESPDDVEIYIGSRVPGFFAWAVPLGDETSGIGRIGLAVDPSAAGKDGDVTCASAFFEKLIRETPSLKERIGPSAFEFVVGSIPVTPLSKTYGEAFLVAGDAAGQCKPVSGGGIYTGLKAADIAGKCAAQAVLSGDVSEKSLKIYESRWKASFGKEIDFGMKFHRFRRSMTDEEMNTLIHEMNDPALLNMITEYGDIDHPSVLITKLLFSKHALKLTKIVGRLIRML
ncbi:MAG: NAD(P)/FAD-dependent oxidoreductase [Methanosarcinaceae archaeon]|nr:NAD(P)/FAD-dependent oxidoreductase [Methanosarcinaceae archaeon]